ncbi:hypothetical protein [Aquidulcibacter sp.]|uniref:hypothetical protein n=1 Tax=Aquidulcibacter sp. TaxID=2052990 RepID=UPI003BA44C8A
MLFNKPPSPARSRRDVGHEVRPRPIGPRPNGPDTPLMEPAALSRALRHAAWRDPRAERKKFTEVYSAVRTLERTAAYVDQALERLSEVAEALRIGQTTEHDLMRGLQAARIEELLDSLERLSKMAANGGLNLLNGESESLYLDFGHEAFRYVLPPFDLRRGPKGLNIPQMKDGFDNSSEIQAISQAVALAQVRVGQFAARLSHDAGMLVRMAKTYEADISVEGDIGPSQERAD